MKRFYFLLLFIVVFTKIVKFLYHCWLCLFFFIDHLTGILSFFHNKKNEPLIKNFDQRFVFQFG